jgi:hypothetical protein
MRPPTLVHGVVRDSIARLPLRDVIITVDGRARTRTDSLGRYAIPYLAVGPHAIGAIPDRFFGELAHLSLTSTDTARQDFALARSPFPSRASGEVWFGCAAALRADACDYGRRLPSLAGFREPGIWVFHDSSNFARFWFAHRPQTPANSLPVVDWATERVFVATVGLRNGCGDALLINRLERRANSTLIVLGPDSVAPGPNLTCPAYRDDADLVVGRKFPGQVQFVPARPGQPIPPRRSDF